MFCIFVLFFSSEYLLMSFSKFTPQLGTIFSLLSDFSNVLRLIMLKLLVLRLRDNIWKKTMMPTKLSWLVVLVKDDFFYSILSSKLRCSHHFIRMFFGRKRQDGRLQK